MLIDVNYGFDVEFIGPFFLMRLKKQNKTKQNYLQFQIVS